MVEEHDLDDPLAGVDDVVAALDVSQLVREDRVDLVGRQAREDTDR